MRSLVSHDCAGDLGLLSFVLQIHLRDRDVEFAVQPRN
jgi:hypothetical protein